MPTVMLLKPTLAAAVLGACALAATARAASPHETRLPAPARASACPLCEAGPAAAVPLSAAEALAAAEALSARNLEELARIEDLRRRGRLGPPESEAARRRARLLAQANLANWYSYLLPLANHPQGPRVVSGEAMRAVFARFTEAGALSPARLLEVRLGEGRVCARYDVSGPDARGTVVLGGRPLPWRLRTVEVDGQPRRVVGMDWESRLGSVEVLVGERYGFALEQRAFGSGPLRGEMWMATGVYGGWLRRLGVHHPDAFAFWTAVVGPESELPETVGAGSLVHLDRLRVKLPLLPGIPCADLRVLSMPMPMLDVAALGDGRLPAWVAGDGGRGPFDWPTLGPVPDELRALLPDR